MDVAPGLPRFRFKFDHNYENHEDEDDYDDDNDDDNDDEDNDYDEGDDDYNDNAEVSTSEVSEGKLEVPQQGQLGGERVQGHQKQVGHHLVL